MPCIMGLMTHVSNVQTDLKAKKNLYVLNVPFLHRITVTESISEVTTPFNIYHP